MIKYFSYIFGYIRNFSIEHEKMLSILNFLVLLPFAMLKDVVFVVYGICLIVFNLSGIVIIFLDKNTRP